MNAVSDDCTILLVDDDPLVVTMLGHILQELGRIRSREQVPKHFILCANCRGPISCF